MGQGQEGRWKRADEGCGTVGRAVIEGGRGPFGMSSKTAHTPTERDGGTRTSAHSSLSSGELDVQLWTAGLRGEGATLGRRWCDVGATLGRHWVGIGAG
jgi:hypothetical protein